MIKIIHSQIKILQSNLCFNLSSILLLTFEIFVGFWIINHVSYTEYDWKSYMQFAEYYFNGERNFSVFIGGTGPYPAGHVYLFNWLYRLTSNGTDILKAQYIFHIIYMLCILSVMLIYKNSRLPDRVFMIFWMCIISYRVHALFTLRLHNDCIATFLVYFSIYLMMKNKWAIGCFIFSLAVSIKMNILLFAPGLLLLLRAKFNLLDTFKHIMLCALIQIILAFEFLITYPIDYIKCAFELTRQFKYYSGIANRFMSPEVFSSRSLHLILLSMQLCALYLMYCKCMRYLLKINPTPTHVDPKSFSLIKFFLNSNNLPYRLTNDFIIYTMFFSNYIGITFSRSIHYNFYVWYYHTLPYLLWNTKIPWVMRFILMIAIEYCYNVFPQAVHTSLLLVLTHAVILIGLLKSDLYELLNASKKRE